MLALGKLRIHVGREDLHDVVSCDLAIDLLRFTGGTLRGDQDLQVLGLEFCFDACGVAGGDFDRLREGLETDVGDCDRLTSRFKVIDEELALSV